MRRKKELCPRETKPLRLACEMKSPAILCFHCPFFAMGDYS